MDLVPPLFYCFGTCPVLLWHGLIAKQAGLVLWLLGTGLNQWAELTRSPIFLTLQSLGGINYLITYSVPLLYFYLKFLEILWQPLLL